MYTVEDFTDANFGLKVGQPSVELMEGIKRMSAYTATPKKLPSDKQREKILILLNEAEERWEKGDPSYKKSLDEGIEIIRKESTEGLYNPGDCAHVIAASIVIWSSASFIQAYMPQIVRKCEKVEGWNAISRKQKRLGMCIVAAEDPATVIVAACIIMGLEKEKAQGLYKRIIKKTHDADHIEDLEEKKEVIFGLNGKEGMPSSNEEALIWFYLGLIGDVKEFLKKSNHILSMLEDMIRTAQAESEAESDEKEEGGDIPPDLVN